MKNLAMPAKSNITSNTFIKPDILSIVVKVTERCNLACPYCYFFFNGDESHKEHPPFVGRQTQEEIVQFIRTAVECEGIRHVRIGLHGGEPLLLKIGKFAEMCELFRSALDPICDLLMVVQTNGVLITPEWIELFSQFKIRVGVSIDGDEAVHNIFRITKKGTGTYAETRRGWNLLNQAMADGKILSAAILCVISPSQSGSKIYRHFIHELKAAGINFLLPDITHDSPEATERFIDGCGDFLIDAFNAWAECGGAAGVKTVRFIHEVIGPMMSDELCRRSFNKLQPLLQFSISSNGEVSPDDVARGLAPRFRNLKYRIGTSRYNELRKADAWKELDKAQRTLPSACKDCAWRNICRGGPFQNRYSEKNGFDNPSVFCKSLKRYYSHVAKHVIASGYPIEQIERRLEMSFDAPVHMIKEEETVLEQE